MISDRIWLNYIRRTCTFILDERKLRSVWLDHKSGVTSVTNFDELFEQLFGDLDSENKEKELDRIFVARIDAKKSIIQFLRAIKKIDQQRFSSKSYLNLENLLNSTDWTNLQTACRYVLEAVEPFSQNELH